MQLPDLLTYGYRYLSSQFLTKMSVSHIYLPQLPQLTLPVKLFRSFSVKTIFLKDFSIRVNNYEYYSFICVVRNAFWLTLYNFYHIHT